MKKVEKNKDQDLLEKLIRGGWTKLLEWFEKIIDKFCEEQAMEERVSVEIIEKRFYTYLAEQFLYSLLTLFSNS